jgi:basic membrane lipoprotein Med (substrate-binding protein (PBP1-ABC) superfamily)
MVMSRILAMIVATIAIAASAFADSPAPLKIAVLSSGSKSDGGWNQLAAESLKKAEKELGAKGVFMEKVNGDKAADLMHDFAAKGYDLVIGHGFEFLTPAAEVSKTENKTKFAVDGADTADGNIASLNFDLAQSCYQLGIIAGSVTKTGKLGFIGGEKIPALISCYKGFLAGAKSVRPDVQVAEAYTSWDKPEDSKAQAETYIHQGVDVILQNVDAASRGVFEAVKEHNDQNANSPVYTFGANSDQNDNKVCPDYTLGSAVIKLDIAFEAVAKSVQDGTFKPGVVAENLANGVCVTVINPKLAGKLITAEIQAAVDNAGRKITAGQLKIE